MFLLMLRRCSSTWTPLGSAFNSPPGTLTSKIAKRLRNEEVHGLFGDPKLKTNEGFGVLKEECLTKANSLVLEAKSAVRKRKLVEVFDDLSDTLCQAADLSEFIRVAHPSANYIYSAGLTSSAISTFVEELNTNRALYNALKNDNCFKLEDEEKYVASLFLCDFEQSGIHLNEEEREKVVKLTDLITNVGQKFANGVGAPRTVLESVIPGRARYAFKSNADRVTISHLFNENPSSLVREIAYRIFLLPDKEQENTLSSLLKLRNDLARICGFETYAERALNGASFFNDPSLVQEFLTILNNRIKNRVTSDMTLLQAVKKTCESSKFEKIDLELNMWDIDFYVKRIKNDQFNAQKDDYVKYFSLGAVMEGLSGLFKSLFGISLIHSPTNPGEVWTNDVYKLNVVHETEGLLGIIYCDFFERVGKPAQDAHFTIRGGKLNKHAEKYQLPVVVVMLNFPQGGVLFKSPCFLNMSMIDNLFHEMGHALHSMLGRTRFQHVTGTRCATDFAEVPSILMEHFSGDFRVLKTISKHYKTGNQIPDDVLKKLVASKWFFYAGHTQQQIFYSILDQRYHGKFPLGSKNNETTTDILREIQNLYYPIPHVENTAWQLRFGHLVGYGAKYYSYLVCKAIASCIWQRHFQNDPFSRVQGEAYRRNLLAYGGSKPPSQIIEEFLKIKPTTTFLAETLAKDIEAKSNELEKFIKL